MNLGIELDALQQARLDEELERWREAAHAAGYLAGQRAALEAAGNQADLVLAAAGPYDGTSAVTDLRQWLYDQIRLLQEPAMIDAEEGGQDGEGETGHPGE